MGRTRAVRSRVVAGAAVTALAASSIAGCAASHPATLDAPSAQALVSAEPTPSEPGFDIPDSENSLVGGLVDGFPRDLLPVPAGAQVLVSSVVPDDDGWADVSLNLRTDEDADDVMSALRSALTQAGFTEKPASDLPEAVAAQSTFAGPDQQFVSVAVLDQGDVRVVTVGGRVRVA